MRAVSYLPVGCRTSRPSCWRLGYSSSMMRSISKIKSSEVLWIRCVRFSRAVEKYHSERLGLNVVDDQKSEMTWGVFLESTIIGGAFKLWRICVASLRLNMEAKDLHNFCY